MPERSRPAVPDYVGRDFADAPPGHRFGLYLAAWDQQFGLIKDGKREALQDVVAVGPYSRRLVRAVRERQARVAGSLAPSILRLRGQSTSPFVTGTGIDHPLENGFAFLSPYGLPYLPGSGIKGVIRHAAEELALGLWGDRLGWDIAGVWWLFGFEAGSAYLAGATPRMTVRAVREEAEGRRERFRAAIRSGHVDFKGVAAFIEKVTDTVTRREYAHDPERFLERLAEERPAGLAQQRLLRELIHLKGALCFWDALVEPAGDTLAVDILNPHFGDYYQSGSTPADCGQPGPNFFLVVPPGSRLDFFVQAVAGGLPDHLSPRWKELIEAAFRLAFDWLGFGAKGAVGYGRMERVGVEAPDENRPDGASSSSRTATAASPAPVASRPSPAARALGDKIRGLRHQTVRSQLEGLRQDLQRCGDDERGSLLDELEARLRQFGWHRREIVDVMAGLRRPFEGKGG